MSPQTRLKLGVALLILGLIMPDAFSRDHGLAGRREDGAEQHSPVRLRNHDNSGRRADGQGQLRPHLGWRDAASQDALYMLVVPILYAWIASYAPSWLPENYVLRVWVNVGLDLVALASLFVLGGDFWDKVRALFLHDARVVSPS
jgi:hypothetical protein